MLLRFLGMLLAIAIALTEPAFAQAQSPYVGRVTTDRVYVRAGQNVNFETVATVNKNDTLLVLSKSFNWLKVKLPPQAKAYVKTEYVDLLTPEVGAVKVDRLNVRSAPNPNATVLGQIGRGARFYVRAKEGDWVSIKPMDQLTGWVKADLVEPKSGAAVPAVLYPEPPSVDKVTTSAPVVPARPVLLKKLTNGQVEAVGILKKENGVYRVYKDAFLVCAVDGPEAVLNGFIGSPVKVRGTVKENATDPNAEVVVSLAKINFIL